MDKSTDNVTILAGVITDILKNYQDKKQEYKALFDIANGYDFSKPTNWVPIRVYIQMCEWIEQNLGRFNLMRIGRNIGESTYDTMLSNKMIVGKCFPIDVMKALIITTQIGVQDPKKRGWEIVSYTDKSVLMRKTQNFNSVLQIGLLDGLIRKSGVMGVKVDFEKEVSKGAEFDEYLITWL
ncbi:MAG: hypothetical protein HXX16_19050 [Bacteroidales bacterium]|nr:hypothetical protein [Bacteroidales bacterium]